MTKEEIENKIKELRYDIFILAMDDHWSTKDFDRDRQMNEELRELERQLEEMK